MSAQMVKQVGRHRGEKSGKWTTRMGDAIWSSFCYTAFGLATGLLLTVWVAPSLVSNHPTWSTISEHIGLGLIVAALSVFAYETGAHMKGVVDLTTDLTHEITRIGPIAEAVSRDALNRALQELLVGNSEAKPYLAVTISQCNDLVTTLSELEKSEIWAHEQYLEFVSYLLGFVVQNAQALQSLGHPEKPSQYFYTMPTSTAASGLILANQMKALINGDRYEVISDLTSWKDEQLNEFHDSTDNAVKIHGVEVIRIFNMVHAHSKGVERIKARQILSDHLKHSNNLGFTENNSRRYQLLVITEKNLGQVESEDYKERIKQAHFGIFTRKQKNLRLRVEVKMPDLSEMILTSNRQEVDKDYVLFKRALAVAKQLTDEKEIENVLDDANLK